MGTSAEMTKNEKQELLARLAEGRERYLSSLRGITEEQAAFLPGEGRWSILQCAEHVAGAEKGMLRLYQKLSVPGSTDRALDERAKRMAIDRETTKRQAPERSLPTGRFANLKDAEAAFIEAREETVGFLRELAEDLRSKTVPHPAGTLDGYQLFMVIATHPERHALQIEEIKRDPAYPRASK